MVGWHRLLNGHEFEQTQGDSEGQGRLACCSSWGRKELDITERLNNNNKSVICKKKKRAEDDLIVQLLGTEAYTFTMITKP